MTTVLAVLASFALTGCGKKPAAEGDSSQGAAQSDSSGGVANSPAPAFFAKDVIAAWEQAGAKTGWIRSDLEGNLWFRDGTATHYGNGPLLKDDVPSFKFEKWPQGGIAKLPAPAVGFGLDLSSSRVTDEQLADLASFKTLQGLDLENTDIGDAGAQKLTALEQLRYLNLHNADLTDAGFKTLAQISSLRYLQVIGLRVSRNSIYQVQNALPKCMMFYR